MLRASPGCKTKQEQVVHATYMHTRQLAGWCHTHTHATKKRKRVLRRPNAQNLYSYSLIDLGGKYTESRRVFLLRVQYSFSTIENGLCYNGSCPFPVFSVSLGPSSGWGSRLDTTTTSSFSTRYVARENPQGRLFSRIAFPGKRLLEVSLFTR